MSKNEQQYLDLCRHVLEKGNRKDDRTGTGTLSTFGYQMRFDLEEGFPLLTTKKLPLRWIFEELRWFLKGETSIKPLLDVGVTIWNGDAYRDFLEQCDRYPNHPRLSYEDFIDLRASLVGHDLGPIYGKQWRSWAHNEIRRDLNGNTTRTTDQIAQVIHSIKNNPDSRRHIVSAWNVGALDDMALPPCHVMFQFYVHDGKLSCQLYQRSGDIFLGVPFNIASYALLTHMIADICGLDVGEFIHTLGDAHIYTNHIEQVKEQLTREPRNAPALLLSPDRIPNDPSEYRWDDVVLAYYKPHDAIKGKVSVG